MREWESDPAKYRHLYNDFEEFVALKRRGIALRNTPNEYSAPLREAPKTDYRKRGVLPPPEYDRPYKGILLEIRGDKETMNRLCPKTSLRITLGCSYVHETDCTIVIANDDILKDAGWTFDIVKRDERAHCLGWPGTHPGARPISLERQVQGKQ